MKRFASILMCWIMLLVVVDVALADLDDGLVAFYPFNGTTNDESGNDHHGTNYGATFTTGLFDLALDFTGDGNYVQLPGGFYNYVSEHFTVALWMKVNLAKPLNYLFWASDDRPGIRLRSTNEVVFLYKDNWNSNPLPGEICGFVTDPVPTHEWIHITTTWDGSTFAGYIDGEKVGEKELPFFTLGGELKIARSDLGPERSFDGLIDEVRIYDRVLLASEIQELYNPAAPGTIKWKFPISVCCVAPAIGHNNTIYVPDGNRLLAVNPDGTMKWNFESSTNILIPSIDENDNIYFRSDGVYALNNNGELLWRNDLGGDLGDGGSRIAIGQDNIYTGGQKYYAIGKDGQLKWVVPDPPVHGTTYPLIGNDGTIYASEFSGCLYSLNPVDGSIAKQLGECSSHRGPPSIDSSGNILVSDQNKLIAVSPGGDIMWRYPRYLLEREAATGADGTIYISSWNHTGWFLCAINPDGAEKWTLETHIYGHDCVPAIGNDGNIYVTGSGGLIAVDSEGSLLWHNESFNSCRSSEPVLGNDGMLYAVGKDVQDGKHYLYAINTSSTSPAVSSWPMMGANAQHTHTGGGPANLPPVLEPIGNKTGSEGQLLEFTILATDPNPGDILTFSASNLPDGATFDSETAIFSWIPDYGQAGNYENVEFSVMDNGDPVEIDAELITITIGNVNRPPEFVPVGSQSVLEGELLEFNVVATDPDGDSIALSHNILPDNATVNLFTELFSWVPDNTQAGNYTIVFYATDDGLPNLTGQTEVVITVGDIPTPIELANQLVEDVTDLDLPKEMENSLMAHLKKVAKFIEKGKVESATNQIKAFILKVERNIDKGKIQEIEGNTLLAMATELILSLVDPKDLEFNAGLSGERLTSDEDIKHYGFSLDEASTVAIISTGTLDLKGRLYERSAGRIICIDADNNGEADQGDRRISNQFTDKADQEHNNFMLRPGNDDPIRLLPSGEYYLAVSLDTDSDNFDGSFGLLLLRRQAAGDNMIEDFFQGLDALVNQDGNYNGNDYLDIYVRALFPDIYDQNWGYSVSDGGIVRERQCKALANFYVNYIFGQGACLKCDCYIDEHLSDNGSGSMLQELGIMIFNSAADPDYDPPELDPARGDVWVSERNLECISEACLSYLSGCNHYGLYFGVSQIMDANRNGEGRLQISAPTSEETKIVRPQ